MGDPVICLVPGTGLGTVAQVNGDVLRILTYQERQPLERCEERETIAIGGRHFEALTRSAVAQDCLHLEDCGALADVLALREVNSKLIEELAASRAEVRSLLEGAQNAKEDKATLSLFPEKTEPQSHGGTDKVLDKVGDEGAATPPPGGTEVQDKV